ncbi:hypothetical protein BN938_2419 [Mucinivorans hirudinis]|uniref:DUF4293 family protein n=1 Tax=Mucinivorans hirudinis TaxID=1433126 RepID=A0A060RE88_9BACT|nr:hypothetical protein BN938_2419 [Mucinivorans hirudinis]
MLFLPLATMDYTASTPGVELETAADGTITKTSTISQSTLELNVWGLYIDSAQHTELIYLTLLVFATAALSLVNILLFKRHWLQVRLCFVLAILLLGILLFEGMYIYKLQGIASTQPYAAVKYSVTLLFPALSLVLTWLAYKGVVRDIALLRSYERIR